MWFYFFAYYRLTLHKPKKQQNPDNVRALLVIFGGSGVRLTIVLSNPNQYYKHIYFNVLTF